MSISISIQFMTGKLHATPWDHQVNEGVVEYPPSPWRILRSLVSAAYRMPETPDREVMCHLLTQLAEHPPSYVLPECTTAHTRHYMPIWKEGKATTTKVFDTFLALPGGALSTEATIQVVWPKVELSTSEQHLFEQLCRQISYLGRSESWVEITVLDSEPQSCNATPLCSGAYQKTKHVKVLAPLTAEGLEGFQSALATLPRPKGKNRWKAPVDVMEALELNIGDLHRQGWNGIPGSRWMTYEVKHPEQPNRPTFSSRKDLTQSLYGDRPAFAWFALSSNVLPNLTEAVTIGERFHEALMSQSKDEKGLADPIFSGRQSNGEPALNHQHAWYLPEVNEQGKIDHMLIYAAGGFKTERAVMALQKLQYVWGKDRILRATLVSSGRVEDYSAAVGPGKSSLIGQSCGWRSRTPMVLPRHPKTYRSGQPKLDPITGLQIDGPEHQVRRLLKQLGRPSQIGEVHIRELSNEEQVPQYSLYRWQSFQRRRFTGQGSQGSNKGYWFELVFQEPQQGAIALGYAAHYGLGVFVPMYGV
jgi:CRISPR-associated protein Csb2